MQILKLTVGLPRSGKSTWAKEQGVPIVNRDAIRFALHGHPFIKETESMVSAIETYMVKSLLLAGNDIVIIDATHLKIEYIERWKIEGVKLKFKYFDTPVETCIERAKKDGKYYLIPIIERMEEDRCKLLENIGYF